MSQTVQHQKNNAAKDGLTNEVKSLHTNEGNPEKATVPLERPKGKVNVAYGSFGKTSAVVHSEFLI